MGKISFHVLPIQNIFIPTHVASMLLYISEFVGLLNLFIFYTDGTDPYYFGTTNLLCIMHYAKRHAPTRGNWDINHGFLYYKEYFFDFHGEFVCLFVCGILSHSRKCHLYGKVTKTGDQYSWPLSCEGSLACHIYTNCDMGYPFIMVILEDARHSHLLPCVQKWSCYSLF